MLFLQIIKPSVQFNYDIILYSGVNVCERLMFCLSGVGGERLVAGGRLPVLI